MNNRILLVVIWLRMYPEATVVMQLHVYGESNNSTETNKITLLYCGITSRDTLNGPQHSNGCKWLTTGKRFPERLLSLMVLDVRFKDLKRSLRNNFIAVTVVTTTFRLR